MPQNLGSHYVLESVIGRGGFGQVWRGRDTDGKPLAFKLLHPTFGDEPLAVERFVRERSILLGLDHPNLVRVRDMVIERSTFALVMDLVEGGDLRAVLRDRGTLPPGEACGIATGVARALTAIHAQGIVHRDIKPENVLMDVDDDGAPEPRITDFGIARMSEVSSESTSLTGTPSYVAPELFDNKAPSAASDLYALGIVLYEMLAGRAPFKADSVYSLMQMHMTAWPQRPDGVPDGVWHLVEDLLAKDPTDRPESASIVVERLTGLSSGPLTSTVRRPVRAADALASRQTTISRPVVPVPRETEGTKDSPEAKPTVAAGGSPPESSTSEGGGSRRRRWVVSGIAALALVVIGLATAVLATQEGPPRPITTAQINAMNFVQNRMTPPINSWSAWAFCKGFSSKKHLKEMLDDADIAWAPPGKDGGFRENRNVSARETGIQPTCVYTDVADRTQLARYDIFVWQDDDGQMSSVRCDRDLYEEESIEVNGMMRIQASPTAGVQTTDELLEDRADQDDADIDDDAEGDSAPSPDQPTGDPEAKWRGSTIRDGQQPVTTDCAGIRSTGDDASEVQGGLSAEIRLYDEAEVAAREKLARAILAAMRDRGQQVQRAVA